MPQNRELTAAEVERQYKKRRRNAGVGVMRQKLAEQLRGLGREYRRREASAARTATGDWLCDNYYVLQREGRQTLRELTAWRRYRRGGELWSLWSVCRGVFAGEAYPLTRPSVETMLSVLGQTEELTVAQLEFLPLALKMALLELSWRAAVQTDDGEGTARWMEQAVTGLAGLPSMDFEGLTEDFCAVEPLLRQDVSGVYPRMAEESRRHYRAVVSKLAVATKTTERRVVEDALEFSEKQSGQRRRHVGYPLLHNLRAAQNRVARGVWALALGAVIPLWLGVWLWWLTGSILPLFPGALLLYEALRPLVSQLALWRVEPDVLPRMEDDPAARRARPTGVVVSMLLPPPHRADELKKRLEQLYFSAGEEGVCFCLLCDFAESDYPETAEDESRADAALRAVRELNRRYGEHFLLFLRKRVFSKTQGRYAGWERKRGAILQLVRYIKGEEAGFYAVEGDPALARSLCYLIALDGDTNLPFESAARLIATAEHPLNAPVVDSQTRTVAEGYGILAPRIVTGLGSASATRFSRLMEGNGGSTAYDISARDLYQDLFGEGIFAGKGLIQVDAFYELMDNRFPEGLILSHDILEGAYLRCGFVSDVELTDSAPPSLTPWLARLHRWIRGDWQNLRFVAPRVKFDGSAMENPIPGLARYMLWDNLRRPLTPVLAWFFALLSPLCPPPAALALLLTALAALALPGLLAAAPAALGGGGVSGLARKSFAGARPPATQCALRALFELATLPAAALSALDAVARALWRSFVSKKKLLEWTTAAQAEGEGGVWKSLLRALPGMLSGLWLLWLSPVWLGRAVGLGFLLALPLVLLTARPQKHKRGRLTLPQRERLLAHCAAMWKFYEEQAGAGDNWLPPDNLQLSPVRRVAHRTSPTNIGMMLLSALAAKDCGLIDAALLCDRVDNTLATIERLEKHRGNLYNWYDTRTLEVLSPRFVSTVDSGNCVACLVALKEGLRELGQADERLPGLIARLEAVIDAADLRPFYDKRRGLFSIGWDGEKGELSSSHYDFLMSEARLTSYFALAARQVGRRHWACLGRAMGRCGPYAGPLSWTGTMFEYLMPHLLLPIYDGSLLDEAMSYCVWCQQRRTKGLGLPWGVSESGFYAFDGALNYQYKAHGVQQLGVKRGLNRELVVSPYSSFLALMRCPNAAMHNLARLEQQGMVGKYGFFEAADYTPRRTAGHPPALVRSYMAHHVGMSMVAAANALFGNVMQQRFMADPRMAAAYEFLQEKPDAGAVVLDTPPSHRRKDNTPKPDLTEQYRDITPAAPRASLLGAGGLTHLFTDCGVGHLIFSGRDLTRRSVDPITDPQGIFVVVQAGEEVLSVTQAPLYDQRPAYRAEFSTQGVTWYAKTKGLDCGLRATMHPSLPSEQLQLVVGNPTSRPLKAKVLFYLEPTLASWREYSAHPAFAKLGVGAREDADLHILTFSRHGQGGEDAVCLSVGFADGRPWQVQTRREELLRSPEGTAGLARFARRPFDGGEGSPDAVCAVGVEIKIAPMGQEKLILLLSAGHTPEESAHQLIALRRAGELEQKEGAPSPVTTAAMEGRLGAELLPRLCWPDTADPAQRQRLAQNTGGQARLWSLGISGDLPLVALDLTKGVDGQRLEGMLRLHSLLRPYGLEYELAVLTGREDGGARRLFREALERAGSVGLLDSPGGVRLLEAEGCDPAALESLKAAAVWVEDGPLPAAPHRREYRPLPVERLNPAPLPEGVAVAGGVFADEGFYIDGAAKGPLPWCHVLANPQFGTLVDDSSPGCTWAFNSRENRLTPWSNDPAAGGVGERVYLRREGSILDLTAGTRVFYSPDCARYEGELEGLGSRCEITVSPTGCAKYCELTLTNATDAPMELDCAYYVEPVLGVTRQTARFVGLSWKEGRILMENPWNTAIHSPAALGCDRKGARAQTNREDFFEGRWEHNLANPSPAKAAALIVPLRLPPRRSEKIKFILSAGRTPAGALAMNRLSPRPAAMGLRTGDGLAISTPDAHLNAFFNRFVPHQTLAGRVWGRSGFFQGGGAYGFRDQLQDVCAALLWDPAPAKVQIYRCCAVQFEEGDVLHWWHPLPRGQGGLRGVRTRYSDDLLWLPYAVARYLKVTGDEEILRPAIHYLAASELAQDEAERYFEPERSSIRESVYDHCVRAIGRACRFGDKGLPLMGGGDWNDGFNQVGARGRGQSVWLGMFLAMVLEDFVPVCRRMGDEKRAGEYAALAGRLRGDIDASCWDGDWYLRAFYDDGSPMGGKDGDACQIDLLPQSFAALAGMPDRERVNAALDAAWERLVDERNKLVKLFAPPFEGGERHNPGYVTRYPAGVRENGGQYTHAAVWYAMALLEAGRVDEGSRLLQMLNPARRCADPALAARYKLEPFYMAGDIYDAALAGRGGWSIYTGSVSWYGRAVAESLCGIELRGREARLSPRLPSHWREYAYTLRRNGTTLEVRVRPAAGEQAPTPLPVAVPLDEKVHKLDIFIEGQTVEREL